jgi:NADP-dependent 3-hydroxy acid dehydrogenase YdfG
VSGHVPVAGARVLLTGATGGLGQAIAKELAGRGASLVLTARNAAALDPIAEPLGARSLVVDLADRDQVARLIDDCGEIDVLVANAALPGSGRVDTYTVEQIDRALDVNLRAPILMARSLSPAMVARGRGQLVFIGSLAGKSANGGGAMYSATKFGIRGFALALRHDLADQNVGVTTINPGFIRDAGMFHDSGAKLPAYVGTKRPADVAAAVVRAIENDPAEIDVAPLGVKAGAAFAAMAPGVADVVTRRLERRARVAEQLGAAQESKR